MIHEFVVDAGSAVKNKKESYEVLDSIRQQKIDAGLQPFLLVKYFSFSSLGVILVFTLFLSWVISNHARNIMLEQSEEYSHLLAENLNQQVFRRFVLPAVVRYGGIALSNPEQFDNLDRIVRGVTQGLKIESVTIYDSSVNVISYSTIPELVGKKDVGKSEYRKSLLGLTNSKLIYEGTLLNIFPSTAPVNCTLKTFIPFRQVRQSGESGDVIMGVIEIVKDLSKDYEAIIRLQANIIFVSGGVMSVLFLVLLTIVSHAGKKMERRVMERLRLEEKLNQSERLAHLGSMVATVSHEIKSPLGIVRSTAEILEKRIKKLAPGNEHLAKIIIDETSRLNGIVMEFLDFARPQKLKMVRGDVCTIVKKALAFIQPKLSEQGVELRVKIDSNPQMMDYDPDLLYRAMLNILVNALQAMEGGGVLEVTAKHGFGGQGMEIVVGDSGIGMTESKIDHIFKPFFTDKNKGTGLGLAITKNIIDCHNGKIRVDSVENEGTTFHISLP